jgi:hypothetical protein
MLPSKVNFGKIRFIMKLDNKNNLKPPSIAMNDIKFLCSEYIIDLIACVGDSIICQVVDQKSIFTTLPLRIVPHESQFIL